MMRKVLPVSFVFVGSKSDGVYGIKLGGGGMRMGGDKYEREESRERKGGRKVRKEKVWVRRSVS